LRAIAVFLLTLGFTAKTVGAVEYIRDEIRVNMRSGPGAEFRILQLLESGDELTRLAENDGWIQVRVGEGDEGWVPSRFVTADMPPSVALPWTKAKLAKAESRIEELEAKLATQTGDVKELTALRERNAVLEEENLTLTWSDTWKKWLTGAAIAGIFLLVGGIWPSSAQRARKIKL
jgi:SH3 domain protein